jgi:dihydropteroate synthase
MTALVGILNLTPDSFSQDGVLGAAKQVEAHLRQLMDEGVDIIDVGAESTRPGATPLTPEEEWARLQDFLRDIIAHTHAAGKQVSLDTRHWQSAEKGLALGVDWINDVSGLRDAQMRRVLAEHGASRIVLMHALSIPADPQLYLPEDADVMALLAQDAQEALARAEASGIRRERIIYDPGVGFGKTVRQNFTILTYAFRLRELGIPLLIGHSRKRFMQCINSSPASERDDLTVALSAGLILQGVEYLRVHAVGKHATLRAELMPKR